MKVKPDGAAAIDLGTTETTPTIGITDYSRRVTDDFGVTTVVERGFSRRMSVRMALPTDTVDAVQRQLANLRATSALWIADASLQWLNVVGFYKDFALDLAVPPLSFCTLTVEGLAETEVVADAGGDPAPAGSASTLRLLQPITVDDAQLFAASVPENDAAAWASGTTYADGARVIRAHRIWESLVGGNVGNDPTTTTGSWLDTGPTNRWAMFDQALGTATTATGSLSATLTPSAPIGAVAFLDAAGATVRVQAMSGSTTVYDQSVAVGGRGVVTFTGLPQTANLKVIATLTGATGSAPVSLGTLLAGAIVPLGITEASPSAGITDYSRKEVDDFGAVTIVQRAWAKRMSAQALIRSDAVDLVANRIAAVRARPSLWIGDSGLDSLSVYGFFKDFSIEVGDTVSKLSLSIEGLSKAAPPAPPFGNGQSVVAQGSVDGVTWHLGLLDGDVFMRISNDSGATFGPAIRIVGEDGEAGEDGAYQQQIFRRAATQPATPTGGGIPSGWSDGVPAGTLPIWLSVQYQRNGIALGPWSAPARITGDKGEPGENAPLVLVQWSVDGMTGWHSDYAAGDKFQRQSVDGGQTYGPAVRVVGESAQSGVDGVSPSIVFRRSATVPATPQQDTGNPPTDWFDDPPPGTTFLWQSVSKFRGAAQLEPWSAPVRISGADGASAITLVGHSATTIVDRNSVRGTSMASWGTDAAHSKESFIGGAIAQWTLPLTHGDDIMAGLAQIGDSVSNGFESITFAIFRDSSGNTDARVNGAPYAAGPLTQAESRFAVRYDYGSGIVSYIINGDVFATYDWGQQDDALFFRTALASNTPRINDVSLLPQAPSGQPGQDGPAGYNNATVTIYRRSSTQPPLPNQPATWTFATASLSGLTNGWTTSIPAGTDPVWAAAATASSRAATDTIAANEWTSPVQAFANGAAGGSGVNTKSLFIYQRAATAPALPSQNSVYTFSSAALTGLNNGWSPTIPDGAGTVWVSTATALSPTDNDNINPGEWAAAAKLAQDGTSTITVSAQPEGLQISVDASGAPVPGALPAIIGNSAIQAGASVPITNVSIVSASGVTASVDGTSIKVTAISGSDGEVIYMATAAGQSVRKRIAVSTAKAGADGAVQQVLTITSPQITSPDYNSYKQQGGSVAINASATGKLDVNLTGNMRAAQGGYLQYYSKLQYRAPDGIWTDVTGSEKLSTVSEEAFDPPRQLSANVNGNGPYSLTGLNANGPYEVRAMTAKANSTYSNSATTNLVLSAKQVA